MNIKMLMTFVAFFVAMSSCMSMFVVKYEVVQKEEALYELNETIITSQKEIHILKAELAHLTDPKRLKKFASKYTDLQEIKPFQIVTLSDLTAYSNAIRTVRYDSNHE